MADKKLRDLLDDAEAIVYGLTVAVAQLVGELRAKRGVAPGDIDDLLNRTDRLKKALTSAHAEAKKASA
ncbi:hypothetical protein [Amycolatopsis sp. DSM 110486]|uniref:hypothetical protein n=1 Tax=Amycolatopsis sp. DSM 110486 TaxID=2865832 RepID=UPI001C698E91|nr:hypothetical protein [Amycolatopsis sp. DSM 110486]QYN17476.1 hypothetical protein K1T34_32340 [Amycolatopsis sp. DSM 110486]